MLRLPAVAGHFYPAKPEALTSLVKDCLAAGAAAAKGKARACLVPHAGLIYSGGVAGAVFSRLTLPRRILLIGVRHYPQGADQAVLSEGAFRTPLGDVPIDTSLALELRRECPALEEDALAHKQEHSLEVELPFLQVLDPSFAFVPIAIGTHDFAELTETGAGIARVLGKHTEEILIVTSSDLNHYEDDATTRAKDQKAIDEMLKLDAKGLLHACREYHVSMCGLGPAIVMLTALQKLGATSGQLIRHATSGDINGDRSAVVGYAGLIFN
ncbi:MAG TPA: AmmeMemoRadiSam system protein B [Candidatus Saccharimonadales bacterium]|nr:AmmeMemoRadiSam system protein B [Candidatus Saccharimonadales bacterium]